MALYPVTIASALSQIPAVDRAIQGGVDWLIARPNRFVSGLGRALNFVGNADEIVGNAINNRISRYRNREGSRGFVGPPSSLMNPPGQTPASNSGDFVGPPMDYDSYIAALQNMLDRSRENAEQRNRDYPGEGGGIQRGSVQRGSTGAGRSGAFRGEVVAQRGGGTRSDRELEAMAESLLGQSAVQRMAASGIQARRAMEQMFRDAER